jgi:hypothetical protein
LQEVAAGGVEVGGEHERGAFLLGLIFCIQNTFVKGDGPRMAIRLTIFCIQK